MTECSDKRFEKLLYAYELGMLSEEEEAALEQHVYGCNYCFQSAREFKEFALLLRSSPSVQAEISSLADPPRTRQVSRLLLLAAVIVLIVLPVYKFAIRPGSVQTLYLTPLRDNKSAVLDLERGGKAAIRFVVEGAGVSDTHRVAIAVRNGPTIYSEDAFAGFNETGQGTIVLPVNRFEKGYYILTVTDVAAKDTLTLAAYLFKVDGVP